MLSVNGETSVYVHKPKFPVDSWYRLVLRVGDEEFELGEESICEADCRLEGELFVSVMSERGVSVELAGQTVELPNCHETKEER